tara:strand:+ start:3545 stop:4276 length:732 start_codon:yes stop_codon:yes gene_type:complete
MKRIFMFDVDGTLTPARRRMTSEFLKFFLEFCRENKVYLVSGSDYDKLLEQVPAEVLKLIIGVFACSGNQYWEGSSLVYEKEFKLPEKLLTYLEDKEKYSGYHIKTGRHIEERSGMINFSTIGRNCTQEQREDYYYWDREMGERKQICERIKHMFPELDCVIGGQISVDIYPMGRDKSQSILYIKEKHNNMPITFFGDRLMPGGNDFPVYSAMNQDGRAPLDIAAPVEGWRETMRILQEVYND